jgi:hypothetical protein
MVPEHQFRGIPTFVGIGAANFLTFKHRWIETGFERLHLLDLPSDQIWIGQDTLHALLLSCPCEGSCEGLGLLASHARNLGYGIPHRYLCKETIGSPELPH